MCFVNRFPSFAHTKMDGSLNSKSQNGHPYCTATNGWELGKAFTAMKNCRPIIIPSPFRYFEMRLKGNVWKWSFNCAFQRSGDFQMECKQSVGTFRWHLLAPLGKHSKYFHWNFVGMETSECGKFLFAPNLNTVAIESLEASCSEPEWFAPNCCFRIWPGKKYVNCGG